MKLKIKLLLISILLICFSSCRYADDASDTAFKEMKVSTLLKKYEYFKDMSANLDKKLADLEIYKNELSGMEKSSKDERYYYELRKSEAIGIASSYNSLAAEYNSAMSKINYSFCNVGELPKGAEKPLPREYKSYLLTIK